MKYIIVLVLVGLFGCTSMDTKDKLCLHIDGYTGFSRCESKEVVCYVSNGGQQCWPKPMPSPSPLGK